MLFNIFSNSTLIPIRLALPIWQFRQINSHLETKDTPKLTSVVLHGIASNQAEVRGLELKIKKIKNSGELI